MDIKEFLQQLITLPRLGKKLLWAGIDFVLLCLAIWLAFFIRLEQVWPPELAEAWPLILAAPMMAIPVFITLGLYQAVIRYIAPRFTVTILKAVSAAALLLVGTIALGGVVGFPRSVYALYWIIALVIIGGSRLMARELLGWRMVGDKGKMLVAIYGAGAAGTQLCKALQASREYQPVAFLDDNSDLHGMEMLGCKVFGFQAMASLIARYRLEEVVLSIPSAPASRRREILESLEPYPVLVKTLRGIPEMVNDDNLLEGVRHVEIEDLLGRDPVRPISHLLQACITGKSVLVTGAGGSIGTELSRQIAALDPKRLVLFDISEFALYRVEADLKEAFPELQLVAILGSTSDGPRLERLMSTHGVQTVYHAAAYKHVPLVEANLIEGVRNNVLGTLTLARSALTQGVETVIHVSTDKAVRPTNVMGASKRMAELILLGLTQAGSPTRFNIVRFGNVLGSSGSVVPRFRRQIEDGGPVTVTHPDITRYFMTVEEAAQLLIQAGSMGQGGDVFLLDMGEAVKILDLARKMVRLSGLSLSDETQEGDIAIAFTGLRPGEKLHEELFYDAQVAETEHPRILRAAETCPSWEAVSPLIDALAKACAQYDSDGVRRILQESGIGYVPLSHNVDVSSKPPANETAPAS